MENVADDQLIVEYHRMDIVNVQYYLLREYFENHIQIRIEVLDKYLNPSHPISNYKNELKI